MNLLMWALFGLVAGGLAKFIMPGKDPGGCLVTILIGIAGAMIGGYLGSRLFGTGRVTGFNVQSLAIAVLGAVLLLAVYRILITATRREDDE